MNLLKTCFLISLSLCLSSCLGTLWTGVDTVYDRHHFYQKMNDFNLVSQVNRVLAKHKTFHRSDAVIDIAVFHGDILLAGHLPSADLMDEFQRRISTLKGYRRLFNEVKLQQLASNSIQDSWITAKIRSQMLRDSSIDPKAFKIITSDRVVYLMGEVRAEQAEKVIQIARFTQGVVKVVKILRYYTYQ